MFAGDKKMTAAFHSTSVSFFLQARLGHKCADFVSGKAFKKKNKLLFFFLTWASGDCRRTRAIAISTVRKASWRFICLRDKNVLTHSYVVTHTSDKSIQLGNVRASWAQITGLEGTFPKQSACCVRHLQLGWRKGCRSVTSFFLTFNKQSYCTEQLCLVPVCL